jgi:hypothetical protein
MSSHISERRRGGTGGEGIVMSMTAMTQLVGGPLDGETIDLDEILDMMPGVSFGDFNWVDLFWIDTQVYIRYVVKSWRGNLALLYAGISPMDDDEE